MDLIIVSIIILAAMAYTGNRFYKNTRPPVRGWSLSAALLPRTTVAGVRHAQPVFR